MKDYLCIGQVLDMRKYQTDDKLKLQDFNGKFIFIHYCKPIKNTYNGFNMVFYDEDNNLFNLNTYSKTVCRQLTDLLLTNNVQKNQFEKPIKCQVESKRKKCENGRFVESLRLV